MKTCFIVNPRASGVMENTVDKLKNGLRMFEQAEMFETTQPGDAERITQQAVSKNCELIVAAGGDGTVNAVLNGMAADFGSALLAVLPLGTGNDFARSIKIPQDLALALEIVRRRESRSIDVISVTTSNTRYFINVSASGFAGEVAEKLDGEVKNRWGPFAYFRAGIDLLPQLTEYETQVVIDDGEEKLNLLSYNLVIANARYIAGGLLVAPQAELDDGLMDIMILPALSAEQLAVLVPQILVGEHGGSEDIIFRRARKVVLNSQPEMPFDIDGEPIGSIPATFEVIPRALRVVVNHG